ncbi:hypothetical protein ABGV43_20520 [Paenibacillus amylolyticus]|uniref:hypothetical protein n=1 Tax=Paenibacillus amylolyticus TaxID=1451 RepID=UPI003241D7AB
MDKYLDGSTIVTLVESLAKILNVQTKEIIRFVQSHQHRIESRGGQSYNYHDPMTYGHIVSHFQLSLDAKSIDGITVHHVASIISQDSFYKYGLLSLKDLFKFDTPFKIFLHKHGFDIHVDEDGTMIIQANEKKEMKPYHARRIKNDRCINGFLFGDTAEKDDSIQAILSCPEFISQAHPKFEGFWKQNATPSVITFKVLLEEIDSSTFETDDEETILSDQEKLIAWAFEQILFSISHLGHENPMIYLKENVSIGADRIVQIRKAELD